jgi:hypothetical protein
MLSMLSFTAMRTIGAQSGGDLPVPTTQSAVTGGPASKAKASKTSNASKPQTPPPPQVEDVPPAVAGALSSGKVVVVLFAERGADDAATSQHFSALSRLGGVRTFRAGIADMGRYAGIVAKLGISQAPAIAIVRPDLKAVPPIEGYVDSQYLLQRVRDQIK